jgi:biotin synthase
LNFQAFLRDLKERLDQCEPASAEALTRLLTEGPAHLYEIFPLTAALREREFGNRIRFCAIVNAKSGLCDQDCAFCGQSSRGGDQLDRYALMSAERIIEAAGRAKAAGVSCFSIIGSGKSPSTQEVAVLCDAVAGIRAMGMDSAVSFGLMNEEMTAALSRSGLVRFHHNMETSDSFYPSICSTRSWRENIEAAKAAKTAGLSICCGGIFGMGESIQDRVSMLQTAAQIGVDSFPVNFLNPIKGTPLENQTVIRPKEALAIIAAARIALPKARVTICGGRAIALRSLQPHMFAAGASGLMVGDYLLTKGEAIEKDIAMIRDLDLEIESSCSSSSTI